MTDEYNNFLKYELSTEERHVVSLKFRAANYKGDLYSWFEHEFGTKLHVNRGYPYILFGYDVNDPTFGQSKALQFKLTHLVD